MPPRKSAAPEAGQQSMFKFLNKSKATEGKPNPLTQPNPARNSFANTEQKPVVEPIVNQSAEPKPPPTPASNVATSMQKDGQQTSTVDFAAFAAKPVTSSLDSSKNKQEDQEMTETKDLKRKRIEDDDDDDEPLTGLRTTKRRMRKLGVCESDEADVEMADATKPTSTKQSAKSGDILDHAFDYDNSVFLNSEEQSTEELLQNKDVASRDYIASAPKAAQAQFKQQNNNETNQQMIDLNNMKHSSKNDNIPPFIAELNFFYHTTCMDSYYPTWLQPDNLTDKKGRRPTDPDYDQTTCYVPKQADVVAKGKKAKEGSNAFKDAKLFSPMFVQYWEVKQNHFDSIVMFKVGKFYEIFFYDAAISNRVCDLAWMRTKMEPHVGFPEAALARRAQMLVDNGYKVIVVEQVETVEEAQKREGKSTVTLKRDVCQVFTSGTITDGKMIGDKAEAQYMMSVCFDNDTFSFGVCIVDCTTSQFLVGHIPDGRDRGALRTVLAQIQPRELVYNHADMPMQVLKMLKHFPCPPKLSPFPNFPTRMEAQRQLDKYYSEDIPEEIKDIKEESKLNAVGGALAYLEYVMLSKQVIPYANFEEYSVDAGLVRQMILDSAALRNLEILETSEGEFKNSLLDFLNHTSTKFGFRLFKRWLCAPLTSPKDINNRLDCVEYFINNSSITENVTNVLKNLRDVERMIARTYAQSVQSERGAVIYSDVVKERLTAFDELLDSLEEMSKILETVKAKGDEDLPQRLKKLTNFVDQGGLFPRLNELIESFRGRYICEKLSREAYGAATGPKPTMAFHPTAGQCEEYDECKKQVDMIQNQLNKELANIRKKLKLNNTECVFEHAKYRFEVTVASSDCGNAHILFDDFHETSNKKGYKRFHTRQISELVVQLDSAEQKMKDSMFPFVSKIFKEFHQQHRAVSTAVNIVAEIDALISLSKASSPDKPYCRPEFVEQDEPLLDLRGCRHPVQETLHSFVSNDTQMGTENNVAQVLLVTGPNMGGKSTVLRQTCTAVLMAQIGCYVPADSCKMTTCDRIFTRLGANDAILEGKSTFLVELEECSIMLKHATKKSLCILDELGRGTSTYDGTAIAHSVLEQFANEIGCRCLFATHYHLLVDEFAHHSDIIAPYHMSAKICEETKDVTFLYKFTKGSCPKSHGMHVARLAGLEPSVVDLSTEKAKEMESDAQKFSDRVLFKRILAAQQKGDEALLKKLFLSAKQKPPSVY